MNFAIREFEDATSFPMDAIAVILVALARIGPIQHEHSAVGTGRQVDTTEPRVPKLHWVRSVAADGARTVRFKMLLVNTPTMEIEGEEFVPGAGWPIVAQIDHQAAMGMTTAQGVSTVC